MKACSHVERRHRKAPLRYRYAAQGMPTASNGLRKWSNHGISSEFGPFLLNLTRFGAKFRCHVSPRSLQPRIGHPGRHHHPRHSPIGSHNPGRFSPPHSGPPFPLRPPRSRCAPQRLTAHGRLDGRDRTLEAVPAVRSAITYETANRIWNG